jgi:hypothetical protein
LKDRGLGPEAVDRAVDAERQFPEELGDLAMLCRGPPGLAPPNMTMVPEMMISGPPTRPSIAIFGGTRPELYIR